MLMNLLPGLRDLRAPLAAGYLWLAALWLLLADAVPPRSAATGVLAHVYVLTSAVGSGTVLAAVSFLAYLVGAVLSVDADGSIVRALARLPYSALSVLRSLPGGLTRKQRYRELYERVLHKISMGQISAKVENDISAYVVRLKEKARLKVAAPEEHQIDIAYWWNCILTQPLFQPYTKLEMATFQLPWEDLAGTMLYNLMREIRQLVTQLRVSNSALFDQYDRARAEAEFRISVAFPLTFLAGVLAWKWTPLWLFLLLGIALILQSGLRRAREATDVVAQAALAGFVTPSGWPAPKTDSLTVARQVLDNVLSMWEEADTPTRPWFRRVGFPPWSIALHPNAKLETTSLLRTIRQRLEKAHTLDQSADASAPATRAGT